MVYMYGQRGGVMITLGESDEFDGGCPFGYISDKIAFFYIEQTTDQTRFRREQLRYFNIFRKSRIFRHLFCNFRLEDSGQL